MIPGPHTEDKFEAAIEADLLAAGWSKGTPQNYRPEFGLDTAELFTFIGATQIEQWNKLLGYYGNDPDTAQRKFAQRVAAETDQRGTLDVLRHGVTDHGVKFKLAYFAPASEITPELVDLYRANRLTVTRQLRYSASSSDELDLALFVNGLPTATAELKNGYTGQTVEDAKKQYRADRDPRELIFARRALAHFAVDTDLVYLTTRLAGARTRFLPFNVGSNGPGVSGGAGNPPATAVGEYRTSYLWRQVWARDNWLDLLRRFLHVDDPATRTTRAAKPPGRCRGISAR